MLVAVAAGGCSIIYNPDKIPSRNDASIDAVPDADPSMLTLVDVAPTSILEGTGDEGSRPEIVVIHGSNFVTGAQVAIAGTNAHVDVDNTKLQVSMDTHYIAVPVTAHVDPDLAAGATISLTVTVTQPVPGGVMATGTLADSVTVQGLDELTSPPMGTSGVDWSKLEPLYSHVELTSPNMLNTGGGANRMIRAVAGITMGDLTAPGGAATTTSAGGAGVGGCPGGVGGAVGQCDGGGKSGGNATNNGAGGGAGFAETGKNGGGGVPGIGGSQEGDDMISTYADLGSEHANHAAGGAGGVILLGVQGGGGGGGGGSIELTAGGNLIVGAIDASGGAGGVAGGLPNIGGGGGAGGVILLRSGGTIATGKLNAAGGAGGHSSGSVDGGNGSPGRVRWEASTGAGPDATSTPTPLRGISFTNDTPLVVTSRPTINLLGTPNRSVNVYTVDAVGNANPGPIGVSIDGSSTGNMKPSTITPGFNRVCVTLTNGMHGAAEAERCIDIAYLP